jgi:hypothetical protein
MRLSSNAKMHLRALIILTCFTIGQLLVFPIPNLFAQAPFTIAVSPGELTLGTKSDMSNRFGVTVFAGGQFNGTVGFQVSGLPPGVSATFENPVALLTSLAVSTTYLDLTSSPNATLGSYTLTVSATSQQSSAFYAASTHVTLIVQENVHAGISQIANATETQTVIAVLGILIGLIIGSSATYVLLKRRGTSKRASRVIRRRPSRAGRVKPSGIGLLFFREARELPRGS